MSRIFRITLLLPLLVLSACTGDGLLSDDSLSGQQSLSASEGIAGGNIAASNVPEGLVPNGTPYRNPAYKNATGRDGGASLTARALMNKDGSTDLEVTTGALDGSTPPHDMTKLQVKYITPDGVEVWTENENKLNTGYQTYRFDDLARHANLQAQANIKVPNASGKGTRNGVVTISERINLRPDLSVTSLSGPENAVANTSVAFVAGIRELNGDLSATANCVFYVDDEEAARSDGLFVGEGDEVSCAMTFTFEEAGTYGVRVAVENVTPADYDDANNTATTTIEIVPASLAFTGSASASEDHSRYYYSSTWYGRDDQRHDTRATFYGNASHALVFPAAFSATQTSGGTLHESVDVASLGTEGATCVGHISPKSTTYICSQNGQTTTNIIRHTGSATYYARNTYLNWYYHCHYSWWWGCSYHRHYYYNSYYSSSSSKIRTGFEALGSDYTFSVRLEDATGMVIESEDVRVDLAPYASYTYGYTRYWGKRGYTTF